MADGLRALPVLKGGAGTVDGTLAAVLNQLQGLALKSASFSPGITANSTVGTVAVSDATSTTLRIDARLPGSHGAKIRFTVTRSAADANLFDLDVFFPDMNATAATITAASAAGYEEVRVAGTKYKKGAGPFMLENTGGGLPGGLSAGSPYWLGVGASNVAASYRVHLTKADAVAGTSYVLLSSDGTGTNKLRPMIYEHFRGSMIDTRPDFIEDLVNVGFAGQPASELIRVTDLDSLVADTRPVSNATPIALSGVLGGECALTGVKRRDHIVGVINLTTGVALGSSDVIAVDTDTVVVKLTGFATNDKLVFAVAPR